MLLEHATDAVYPEIIRLVNAAYRGDGSATESWNTEAGILEGTRTDESLLCEEAPARTFLFTAIQLITRSSARSCLRLQKTARGIWGCFRSVQRCRTGS